MLPRILLLTSISTLALFASLTVQASYKTYEAEIGESSWQFNGNPLSCKLIHKVPFYGDAIFDKQAGIKQPLSFKLNYKRQPINAVSVATVRSLAPSWLPQQRARDLGEVEIMQGQHIFKTSNIASWKLLNELEVGRFPTFRYQDFESAQDKVSVSLSAVGFKHPYEQFLDCLTSLVPFKLHQLNKMTLRFDFDKHSIRQNYHEKLQALAAYVRHDPNVEVVFIHGYTDSKGSRGYNHKLSEKRIASVQKMLSLDGVDSSRFKTLAFGEKKPVASNRSAKGRALNRRVYIRVSQK